MRETTKRKIQIDLALVRKLKTIAAAAEAGESVEVTGLSRGALLSLLFTDGGRVESETK